MNTDSPYGTDLEARVADLEGQNAELWMALNDLSKRYEALEFMVRTRCPPTSFVPPPPLDALPLNALHRRVTDAVQTVINSTTHSVTFKFTVMESRTVIEIKHERFVRPYFQTYEGAVNVGTIAAHLMGRVRVRGDSIEVSKGS